MIDMQFFGRASLALAVLASLQLGTQQLEAQQLRGATIDTLKLRRGDLPRLVRGYNPLVGESRFEVSLASGDVTTARLKPNPQLELMADILPFGSAPKAPADRQYGLQLAFPLELGNKRRLRTTVAEQTRTLALQEEENTYAQQLAHADISWLEYLASLAIENIAATTVENYEKLLAISRLRLEGRQISEAEYARIAVEHGRASIALEDSRIATNDTRLVLGQILGRSEVLIPLDSLTVMSFPAVSSDSLVLLALSQRADIKAVKLAAEVAHSDQQLQHAISRPDVSFGIDYGVQQRLHLYGFTVGMPLPRNNRNQGEREKAAARIAQTQIRLERIVREVQMEVDRAMAIVASRQRALARFGDRENGMLEQARRAREAAEFAYRNGATSLVELLDAERSYDEVNRSYVEAITALNRSVIELYLAIGLSPIPPS